MNIDTNTMVPISVANQNFSKVAKLVDQFGSAVIMKNNAPRYIIYEFNQADAMQAAADDDVLASSLKLMDRNKHVYTAQAILNVLAESKLGSMPSTQLRAEVMKEIECSK